MHRLLQRQIRRYIGQATLPPEVHALLRAVDQAYQHGDEDRALLERSMELSSDELEERYLVLNEQLEVNQRAKADLLKTVSMLDATLNATSEGILVVDTQGKPSKWNAEFGRLWGLPNQALNESSEAQLMEEGATMAQQPHQFMEMFEPDRRAPDWEGTDTVLTKDDRVLERFTGPQMLNDKCIGRLWSFRDVTAARATAIRLEQAQRVFEASLQGIVIVDQHFSVIDANPSLCVMLNATLSELKGKSLSSVSAGDWPTVLGSGFEEKVIASGQWHGELCTGDPESSSGRVLLAAFSTLTNEHGELSQYVGIFSDISDLKRAENRLRQLADYDSLTGLFNRRSFENLVNGARENALESGKPCFLLFLDLDQFKVVNDNCGHAAGDKLLVQVAHLLLEKTVSGDSVGRLGGDEFGVLLGTDDQATAMAQADSIRTAVEQLQFLWNKEIYRIGVSAGCVRIDDNSGDVNELIQLADAACYAAKDAGRNQIHLVQGEKDQAVERRAELRWVQRLNKAMEQDCFALFGQKVVPLKPSFNEPERMEILLRMRDRRTQKLVPPGAFMPAAERYGLSPRLDEWVVSNLVRSAFVHEAILASPRQYWVNLSGASVGDAHFCNRLIKLMKNSPLPPGMLNFEITETAVIHSLREAARLIATLKDMGCAFALDDFGSGLSSFGHLKRLQVDFLKIDGMFVKDILDDETNSIFVKSIIDIAHSMNIGTIAECVENDQILNHVKALGADYGQGFGLHRPELLAPQFPMRQASA